jgi:hypothetical protein
LYAGCEAPSDNFGVLATMPPLSGLKAAAILSCCGFIFLAPNSFTAVAE